MESGYGRRFRILCNAAADRVDDLVQGTNPVTHQKSQNLVGVFLDLPILQRHACGAGRHGTAILTLVEKSFTTGGH